MITKQDIESLNELVNGYPKIQDPLFSYEASESLTQLAFKHYPMLRVINSNSIIKFEEKIAMLSAELEIEICALTGEPIES